MGRYQLALALFGVVVVAATVTVALIEVDRIRDIALIAVAAAGVAVLAFLIVSVQRRVEATVRSLEDEGAFADRMRAQQARMIEVAVREMPEAHAEQLMRAFEARSDRIEHLLREHLVERSDRPTPSTPESNDG